MLIKTLLRDPKLYQYVLVGGLCALVDISLFLVLKAYFSLHYLLLATFSFFVATLFNFLLCTTFVFTDAKRSARSKFALTYLVSGVGLSIHHTCLLLGVEWLMLPLVFSKLGAMGVAFVWNFLSRKYLVFSAA